MVERRSGIEFFFDFMSPYGWIAAEQVGALARQAGREVDWVPFLLKATVVEAMGLKPVLDTPLKGAYALHDCRRLARLHGLSISAAARFTFSPLLPARAAFHLKHADPARMESFVLALYRRHWRDAGDISRPDEVLSVAQEVGLDTGALAEALEDPGVKAGFRRSVEDTIARGVFGSPTVIVDGEPFWGADRLDQVALWLRTGGW